MIVDLCKGMVMLTSSLHKIYFNVVFFYYHCKPFTSYSSLIQPPFYKLHVSFKNRGIYSTGSKCYFGSKTIVSLNLITKLKLKKKK